MVFIRFSGLGGSFEAHALLAFTPIPWSSKGPNAASTGCGKTHFLQDLPELPWFTTLSKQPRLPVKQAQIEPKKAKEELKPPMW